jgi:hypothetical protein
VRSLVLSDEPIGEVITKRKNKCQGCPLKLHETLQIINKPNRSKKKKGRIQGTKWKAPCPRRQKNHLRGPTTKGTSSS